MAGRSRRRGGDVPLKADFVADVTELLGAEAGRLIAALDQPGVRALRANRLKATLAEVAGAVGFAPDPVPWCGDASHLDAPAGVALAATPAVGAGLAYVQEPSAMAVVEALGVRPGEVVLDVAASPGGKATHLAAGVGAGGVLVANEVGRGRLGPLLENLERWGHPATMVTSMAVADLAATWGAVFDRAVLDAPCSGEAMFRKDAGAREQWSRAHVAGCARRQHELLGAAAATVRPGGTLAYSTCTFNRLENEDVVDGFLAARPAWELVRVERHWPHLGRVDGHFVAVLRAPDDGPRPDRPPARRERPTGLPTAAVRAATVGLVPADLDWDRVVQRRDSLYLEPDRERVPRGSGPGAGVVLPGLHLGQVRGGRFEPSHALALSVLELETETASLDLDEATRFLAGQPIDRAGPHGWVRVLWDRWPIGWARRSGDRLKPRVPRRARTP